MFKHPAENMKDSSLDLESDEMSEIKNYEESFNNYEWRVRSVLKAHDNLYEKHLAL